MNLPTQFYNNYFMLLCFKRRKCYKNVYVVFYIYLCRFYQHCYLFLCVDLGYSLAFFHIRTPFCISCRQSMLVKNSLCFCLQCHVFQIFEGQFFWVQNSWLIAFAFQCLEDVTPLCFVQSQLFILLSIPNPSLFSSFCFQVCIN